MLPTLFALWPGNIYIYVYIYREGLRQEGTEFEREGGKEGGRDEERQEEERDEIYVCIYI